MVLQRRCPSLQRFSNPPHQHHHHHHHHQSMDHSFNDRVDKVFGSISSSSSSTPWSLTDAQVERRVWNRDKGDNRDDDQTPVSSSFPNLFNAQRNRTKCLHDDGQIGFGGIQLENDGDEWDIRSSIGLDATLDTEEEEDAYDKMAEGRENAGDRLYMKDVTDHGPYLNSHNILPSTLQDVKKDPRANHDAAKTRLKEDDVGDELMLNAEEACASKDGIRIKSILKRKRDEAVKPAKRVRFDSSCKNDDELLSGAIQVPKVSESGPNVPDYILNPSKYTQYSFNESCGEEAAAAAYLDFLEQVKNSKHVGLDQTPGELSKSVVFIPRKKRSDGEAASNKQSSTQAGSGIGIAAAALEMQQGEISAMQEDESHVDCTKTKARSQKASRQYRNKMGADDEDI